MIGAAAFGGRCTVPMKDIIIGKLRLIGKQSDVDGALEVMPDVSGMTEAEARLKIQAVIDKFKFNVTVLYGGNIVWSFDRTIRDFKRALNAGSTTGMTHQLYQFFSLSCGTIAHFNAAGWAAEYPDRAALRQLFLKNELGARVLNHVPEWKTDAKRIVSEMETLLGITKRETPASFSKYRTKTRKATPVPEYVQAALF